MTSSPGFDPARGLWNALAPADQARVAAFEERRVPCMIVGEVTLRQRHSLDLACLGSRIRELGARLDRPEIVACWERWKHDGAD